MSSEGDHIRSLLGILKSKTIDPTPTPLVPPGFIDQTSTPLLPPGLLRPGTLLGKTTTAPAAPAAYAAARTASSEAGINLSQLLVAASISGKDTKRRRALNIEPSGASAKDTSVSEFYPKTGDQVEIDVGGVWLDQVVVIMVPAHRQWFNVKQYGVSKEGHPQERVFNRLPPHKIRPCHARTTSHAKVDDLHLGVDALGIDDKHDAATANNMHSPSSPSPLRGDTPRSSFLNMLKSSGFSFSNANNELDDDLETESSEDTPDTRTMYAWPRFQLSPHPSQVPFPDFLLTRLPHLRANSAS